MLLSSNNICCSQLKYEIKLLYFSLFYDLREKKHTFNVAFGLRKQCHYILHNTQKIKIQNLTEVCFTSNIFQQFKENLYRDKNCYSKKYF